MHNLELQPGKGAQVVRVGRRLGATFSKEGDIRAW